MKKQEIATQNTQSTAIATGVAFIGQFVSEETAKAITEETDADGKKYQLVTYEANGNTYAITSPTLQRDLDEAETLSKIRDASTMAFYAKLTQMDNSGEYHEAFSCESIGDFAHLMYGLKKDTVVLYVRTMRTFYNFNEDGTVSPKSVLYKNVDISKLAQCLGFINAKCEGKLENFTKLVADGDIHLNQSQAKLKKELAEAKKVIGSEPPKEATEGATEAQVGNTTTTTEGATESANSDTERPESYDVNLLDYIGKIRLGISNLSKDKQDAISLKLDELAELIIESIEK